MTATPVSRRERVRRTLWRTAVLTVVWLVVSLGDLPSLVIGIPLAFVGAVLWTALQPTVLFPVSPRGLVRFIGFFGTQSVLGGVDVALRALSPRLPLKPACVMYPLRITGTGPRVFLANTISLLPGTLSARVYEDALEIHVLDRTKPVFDELARVEERVADLFGANLPPREPGGVG